MRFLKVLWDNVVKGPVTEPFPAGEAYTPPRFRGKVAINAALCVGCGTCQHVCAAGAINITRKEDESGFVISVWHNSCCLCAQCRHYCPTKAITLTNDWHNAHRNEHKYTWIERAEVLYDHCEKCGAKMRFLPQSVVLAIYDGHDDVNVKRISHLCPECRRIEVAIEEDKACHINHLETLAAEDKACLMVPPLKAEGETCELPEQQAKTTD